MASQNYSIVEFFGGDEDDAKEHDCGYCKNKGSISTGMWAHVLNVQDYQDLIDRGWRRSGCYLYKPTMRRTCCPAYTIKCDVSQFQLSKSQKKVLKRFNKYMVEGLPARDSRGTKEKDKDGSHDNEPCTDLPDLTERAEGKVSELGAKIIEEIASSSLPTTGTSDLKESKVNSGNSSKDSKEISAPTALDEGSRRPCKKAKLMRKERRIERLLQKGLNPEEVKSKNVQEAKTLEEHLQDSVGAKHKLELRLVQSNPPSYEYKTTETESFNIYKKYQVTVHDDPPEKITLKQFTRFLVDSPLEPEESNSEVVYGSFHQQYWLDEKLIAVAVIDVLPYCVSSVYFYYDPDFRFLTLGTYAALREIAFTKELQVKEPEVASYYMGFYIHSCPKMRYKGQYNPSFLLCPAAYTWHTIDKCRALLEKSKYSGFDIQNEEKAVDENDMKMALVLYNRKPMTFPSYISKCHLMNDSELKELKFYVQLVGPQCASRILLYRA